jgi:plastocyanin
MTHQWAIAGALLVAASVTAACGGAPQPIDETQAVENIEAAAAPVATAADPTAQTTPAPIDQSTGGVPLPPPGSGAISGRIHLTGQAPGNPVIRMGADPLCSRLNRGNRVVQEAVAAAADGSLANVFVTLDGSFPESAVPSTPVTLDQAGCVYAPRVVGVRVGQTLAVRNSDPLMHNVHGVSATDNGFNVSQPTAGMLQEFPMVGEETMLRLRCDVHNWMTGYVGVVSHPYFAVTGEDGAFDMVGVPPGTYTVRTWHERFGELTQTIRVTANTTATVDLGYTGSEEPPSAGIRDLHVPAAVAYLAVG